MTRTGRIGVLVCWCVTGVALTLSGGPVEWLHEAFTRMRQPRRGEALDAPAGDSLCTPAHGCTYAGSLATGALVPMLEGREPLQRIEVCPHDLVVSWPGPVAIGAHRIVWDSPKIHARHYGLEYWDDADSSYRLLYEARGNKQDHRTHPFTPVTTRRVRFTVFDHPLEYNSLIIREFTLLPANVQEAPVPSPAP